MKKYLTSFLFLFLASCQTAQHEPAKALPKAEGPLCSGKMNGDKREGLWVCKDANGQKIEINYEAGLRNGRMNIYQLDEKLSVQSEWKNGVLEGEMITYFSNGKPEIYSQMKNGKIHGMNKEWDKEGHLLSECAYADGLREGKCLTWYSNGKNESSAIYKKNLLDGPYADWYESGIKRSEVLYKSGKILKEKYWTADGERTKEVLEPYL